MNLNAKELKILSFVVAFWGIVLLSNGCSLLSKQAIQMKKVYTVNINSNQEIEEQEKQATELKLKDVEIEVGTPISTNAKDYIVNSEQFSELQIKQLTETLDTSLVNINQPGTYKFTLIYKKKKYEGVVKVSQKELPNVTFTLKAKIMPTTGTLSRNKRDYVYEELAPEVYNNMILDLREVEAHQSIPGKYKYTITYKDTTYYGDFEIVEDVITNKVTITCPSDSIVDNVNKTCVCNDDNKEYNFELKQCVLKPTNPVENTEE